ncbi:MAG: methyltransferase domain-containing protein [Bdellovibrionales bacterium]|nr:methyltransferase domain-containing protein [Bdellovibrionales bacterium]
MPRCKTRINKPVRPKVVSVTLPDTFITVDYLKFAGAQVTDQLSMPVSQILGNLGTHEGLLYGKTVISAGEGIGNLLPHLLARDISALGVDLFYFSNLQSNHPIADAVREYESLYGQHLKRGDATKLPFPDNSTDVYVSHALVNNLKIKDRKKVLREALRVTDVYGEVYIFGFDASDISWIANVMTDHQYAWYRFERVEGVQQIGSQEFTYTKYRLRIEL